MDRRSPTLFSLPTGGEADAKRLKAYGRGADECRGFGGSPQQADGAVFPSGRTSGGVQFYASAYNCTLLAKLTNNI